MNEFYLGIDPGKDGGIALLSEGPPLVYVYSDQIMLNIASMISGKSVSVCLEKVASMPNQGVKGVFTFGRGLGFIEGVLQSYQLPYQLVPPIVWKKEFSLNSDKQKSIEACRKLFPMVDLKATERCTKYHDGKAEALLMAEYARRKL